MAAACVGDRDDVIGRTAIRWQFAGHYGSIYSHKAVLMHDMVKSSHEQRKNLEENQIDFLTFRER